MPFRGLVAACRDGDWTVARMQAERLVQADHIGDLIAAAWRLAVGRAPDAASPAGEDAPHTDRPALDEPRRN